MGIYHELSNHTQYCLLKTVHQLSFVHNKLSSQNWFKTTTILLVCDSVGSKLGWAQLGGSSVGFTWGHYYGYNYLVAQLRPPNLHFQTTFLGQRCVFRCKSGQEAHLSWTQWLLLISMRGMGRLGAKGKSGQESRRLYTMCDG